MKNGTAVLCRRAMLLAAALIFGYIEAVLPPLFGISGFHIGIANIVVMTALISDGLKCAAAVNAARILLLQLLFGNIFALVLSLCGGMLAVAAMYFALKIRSVTPVGASALGGAVNNFAQTLVAAAVVGTVGVVKLLPFMLVIGTVTGALCGVIAAKTVEILSKTALFTDTRKSDEK